MDGGEVTALSQVCIPTCVVSRRGDQNSLRSVEIDFFDLSHNSTPKYAIKLRLTSVAETIKGWLLHDIG